MSNTSLSQELKSISTNINGNNAGFAALLTNSKNFNAKLTAKLNAISQSIRKLSELSKNKNTDIQNMKQNLQSAQQKLAECTKANAGQNAEITKILEELKKNINAQDTSLKDLTGTSNLTTQTFDKLTTEIDTAIAGVMTMMNSPPPAPGATLGGGYRKRKHSVSKKNRIRIKKGGWVIDTDFTRSSKHKKTKKRKSHRNTSSSSSSRE